MAPLVSVVMPAYNAEQYVAESVESILNQTFTDFEFIVVNDGSTDKTADIVKAFSDSRIILIDNQENAGQPTVRNQGIALAKGKYIAMMDADDESLPTRLQQQVDFMESNPEIGILGTAALLVKEGKVIKTLKKPLSHFGCLQHIIATCPFLHNSVMLRKSKIPQGVQYDETRLYAEDSKLWMDFYNHGVKMANLEEPLVTYRIHGNNVSLIHWEEQQKSSVALRSQFTSNLIGERLAHKHQSEITWLTKAEFGTESKTSMTDIASFYRDLSEEQRQKCKFLFNRAIRYNLYSIDYRYSSKIPAKWTWLYLLYYSKDKLDKLKNLLKRVIPAGNP